MVEVIYKDVSPAAKRLNVNEANSNKDYSNISQIKNDSITVPRYITLEKNLVALDDNNKFIEREDTVFGYVSAEMSDENGNVNNPVQLIRTFVDEDNVPAIISSVGVTFEFSSYFNNYPSELQIDWYNIDNEIIATKTFYPDNYMYFCQNNVELFTKQIITFKKTNNPYRFIKIAKVEDGVVRTFKEDEIRDIKITEEINPISEEVSINEMDFSLDSNADVEFLFQKKQEMRVRYNEELIGIYFINNATQRSAKQFDIKLEDYLGLLDKSYFYGGIYNEKPVDELIAEIITDVTIPYEIEENLKAMTVTGYIPICTRREALQQVAFAICAVIDTSRTEKISIHTLKSEVSEVMTEGKTFNGGTYTTNDIVTAVRLVEHLYQKNGEEGEVFRQILNGEAVVEFSNPIYDLNIVNGTIIESGVNYAIINGTGEEVTLTAKNYTHTEITHEIKNSNITIGTKENTVVYDTATLINANNVDSVLLNIFTYLLNKENIDVTLQLDNAKVGDLIEVSTEYKGSKKARITNIDLSLSTKKIGKVTAIINE